MSNKNNDNAKDRIWCTVPAQLKRDLEAFAAQEERNLTDQIVYMLRMGLKNAKKTK